MKNVILSYLRGRARFATDEAAADLINSIADDIEDMPEAMIEKEEFFKPYLLGGVVTRKVLRCSSCLEEVGFRDRYCKACGRRFLG